MFGYVSITSGYSLKSSSGNIALKTANAGEKGVSGGIALSTGTSSTGASGAILLGTGTGTGDHGGDIIVVVGTGDTNDGGEVTISAGETTAKAAVGGRIWW